MDAISIRCTSCKYVMKFPGEKAGKKAKCPKCGTVTVIAALTEPAKPAKASDPPPAKQAAPPKPAEPQSLEANMPAEGEGEIKLIDVDSAPVGLPPESQGLETKQDDVPAIKLVEDPDIEVKKPVEETVKIDPFAADAKADYDVFTDPELIARQKALFEEEEAKSKSKKKDKKKLPKVARKIKAIEFGDDWAKVRIGMLLIFVGLIVWIVAHFLQGIYVLLGSTEQSEYANLIHDNLLHRGGDALPGRGQFWDVDWLEIYLGMIVGKNYLSFAQGCLTIASILYFVQAICWVAGYVFCLSVPRRFGMGGNIITCLVLSFFNAMFMLVFKLLPVVGAVSFVMLPFVVPELCMTEYNMERMVPINVLWSGAPFWENFLNAVIRFSLILEPTMFCVFLWSVGLAVKDDGLEQSGKQLAQLCLGTFFIQLAYFMLSICGASPVLVTTVRIVYTLWYGFVLMFMFYYAPVLLKARAVLDEKINPTNELT